MSIESFWDRFTSDEIRAEAEAKAEAIPDLVTRDGGKRFSEFLAFLEVDPAHFGITESSIAFGSGVLAGLVLHHTQPEYFDSIGTEFGVYSGERAELHRQLADVLASVENATEWMQQVADEFRDAVMAEMVSQLGMTAAMEIIKDQTGSDLKWQTLN